MRQVILSCILAMLISPLSFAYELPGHDAPDGAEVYILTFEEPGALHYKGDVNGFNDTSKVFAEKSRNRAADPDVRVYREHLNARVDSYANQMSGSLSRPIEPILRYNVFKTGMAALLTADEAQHVANMPGVIEVRKDVMYELDTDVGPQWIGAHHIWQGFGVPGGEGTRGEGVVVGILDSGINLDHPSFSDNPEDPHTYVNPFGDGNFVGACASDPGTYVCNNKLIGAWDFADPFGEPGGADGPEDNNGHGSHTASTAAGNYISGPFLNGGFAAPGISGVARHANIIAYDVCTSGCPGGATASAQEQAILDGVDVINFSIGPTAGGGAPWSPTDSDLGFLDVVGAGVVVAASAGNNGPTPGLVSHLGPWMMTVANLTHNRSNQNPVSVIGAPANLQDMWGQLGSEDNFGGEDLTDDVLWAGSIDPANFEGCNAWPNGNEFNGVIALISRGSCNFSVKIDNAEAAGAVGVLVFNHLSDIPFSMGSIESANIPSLMIGKTDGEAMRDYVIGNPGSMATMSATSNYVIDDNFGSWANSGSSRGPNNSFDVTKPDLGAPGTNVFAAYADVGGPPPQYAFLSGTSMASPHAAGAAALIKAVHPDWTPAEIKSAMMMTATAGLDEAGNPSNPDIEGTGTVDLGKAALSGLTMNETYDNFLAANPATGGDPSTLNLPSLRSNDCNGTCTWTRTVCSTLDTESTWEVDGNSAAGINVTFTPTDFDLLARGTSLKQGFEDDPGPVSDCQTITYTIEITDMALVTAGELIFLNVLLGQAPANTPALAWTVAFLPTGVVP